MVDDELIDGEGRVLLDVTGRGRSRTMRGVTRVWDLASAGWPKEGG